MEFEFFFFFICSFRSRKNQYVLGDGLARRRRSCALLRVQDELFQCLVYRRKRQIESTVVSYECKVKISTIQGKEDCETKSGEPAAESAKRILFVHLYQAFLEDMKKSLSKGQK